MANESSTVALPSQHAAVLPPDHTFRSDEPLLDGPYPPVNYLNYPSSPAHYTANAGVYNGPAPPVTGPVEPYIYQGNHCAGYPPFGIVQHFPVAPGPSQVGYNVPLGPMIPNDSVVGWVPPPPNVAGPSREIPNSNPVSSEMIAEDELKRLARRYLQNPESRVDRVRMRQSGSGRFKVMIMLEIDNLV
ncbi:hypothetical protein B0F90DRAFT_1819151 [Multifurca ochricompacta]|uniref:Uncharacterized protein n=1 Tax=Multifurca ochricompacta TaxID=376703 RepID=A0AAD4M2R1_9AGAM|nr:hypothetical protein B0F90DRAFT_1819151 [Multifurca ochricompacta]